MTEKRVALAAVAGAHGVKGEVRLKLFTDSAAGLAPYEKVYVGGTERRLLNVRDGGKAAIARFEGVADRSAAEALRGSLVEVDRSALPPLEEGEYYHSDLVGLDCVDRDPRCRSSVWRRPASIARVNPSAPSRPSRISGQATCWRSPSRTGVSR